MIDKLLLSRLRELGGEGLPDRLAAILDRLVETAEQPHDDSDPMSVRRDLRSTAEFLRKVDGPDALPKARAMAERQPNSTFARTLVVTIEWLDREEKRVAELYRYGILDTPTEAGFDDIVFIAAHVCEASIAAINFVDGDRQWSKAALGVPDHREIPLEQSICAQVYGMDRMDLIVIPDMQKHPRTTAMAIVSANDGLRFYAAAPLLTPDGIAIGTLCVFDQNIRPEGLTDTQKNILQGLARQVMTQMELRRLLMEQAPHGK